MRKEPKQNLVSNFIKTVEVGREGLNKGIETRLEGVDEVIDGITSSTATVILGGTGSGKTTYAMFYHVYEPLCQAIEADEDFYALIYSLEMSSDMLLAKLLSLRLYDQHGIILTYKDIMSRKNPLNDENFQLMLKEVEWLQEAEKKIFIVDRAMSGSDIAKHIQNYMKLHGEVSLDTGKYVADTPSRKIVVLIDHVGLLTVSPGNSLKKEIDDMSRELIALRNFYGISPVLVQQLNRSSNSMDRRKAGLQEIELQDAKDTGSTLQDADIVIGLFFPHREKVETYMEYDIKRFKDRFRGWLCLKNRFGEVGARVPLCFWGEIGFFKSIKEKSQASITEMGNYLSPKFNNPNYTWTEKKEKKKPSFTAGLSFPDMKL